MSLFLTERTSQTEAIPRFERKVSAKALNLNISTNSYRMTDKTQLCLCNIRGVYEFV